MTAETDNIVQSPKKTIWVLFACNETSESAFIESLTAHDSLESVVQEIQRNVFEKLSEVDDRPSDSLGKRGRGNYYVQLFSGHGLSIPSSADEVLEAHLNLIRSKTGVDFEVKETELQSCR